MGAVTVTTKDYSPTYWGSLKVVIGTVTFSSSYATGGDTFIPLDTIGLTTVLAFNALPTTSSGGLMLQEDLVNNKLLLLYPTGSSIVPSTTLGDPGSLAPVSLTTQGAIITATNLVASATAGLYRVTYYAVITQAATTSSSLNVQIGWNDGTQAQTATSATNSTNTLGAFIATQVPLRSAAAQAITYATPGYLTSGATPMQYSFFATVDAGGIYQAGRGRELAATTNVSTIKFDFIAVGL